LAGYFGGADNAKRFLDDSDAYAKYLQGREALSKWNSFSAEQKKSRFDEMPRLSFSTISQFATDPLSFVKEQLLREKPKETMADTELGQAAHAAIESFMQHRLESNDSLSQDELLKYQKEAVEIFDEYLGFGNALGKN